MVRIPASSAGIFSFVQRKPVTTPEIMPATQAMKMAGMGCQPAVKREAATAAPKGKEPSTVRSAISSTRKVR